MKIALLLILPALRFSGGAAPQEQDAPDAPAGARIIITEIMYNPASLERNGETEWIEIANVGDEPVTIENWTLQDEDSQAWAVWGAFSCTLAPRQVAVLVNEDAVTEQLFRAAWDAAASPSDTDDPSQPAAARRYLIVPMKWGNLANAPTSQNEILRLVDGSGSTVCELNFQSGGVWPRLSARGGSSIWLADLNTPNLSRGQAWKESADRRDGAWKSAKAAPFSGSDIGSPGLVPGLPPPDEAPIEDEQTGADAPSTDNRIDY